MGKDLPDKQLLSRDEFKKTIKHLLKDYVEVKKEALEIGYKDDAIKVKDYIEYYVRLNESK